ncbi:hypothetical protein NliqN6_6045 [Naganishia liquefaciens]|uniref:YebC-like protein n=1 Tax=Naganishia liquefaciens TaxID=104408 RepID=A0A8H3TZH2_9TREE|nr:hypothetical protein NliqN6_6045 [Naganishia liquefaciens]
MQAVWVSSAAYRARMVLQYTRRRAVIGYDIRQLHAAAVSYAGHNRWSKIRHRKGAADAARSAQFSKVTNEIYMSLRPPASPDPADNPRFAAILAKARELAYPKANLEAAIAKALNPHEGVALQNITYEAIGAGGQVSFIIECLTDNTNRAVSKVKEMLSKYGCRFSPVAFQFERKGRIQVVANPESVQENEAFFEQLFDAAAESGAEDVRIMDQEDDKAAEVVYEVITSPTELSSIASSLQSGPLSQSLQIVAVEQAYIPTDPVYLPGSRNKPAESQEIEEDAAEKAFNVLGALDEVADVSRVWTNVVGMDS